MTKGTIKNKNYVNNICDHSSLVIWRSFRYRAMTILVHNLSYNEWLLCVPMCFFLKMLLSFIVTFQSSTSRVVFDRTFNLVGTLRVRMYKIINKRKMEKWKYLQTTLVFWQNRLRYFIVFQKWVIVKTWIFINYL